MTGMLRIDGSQGEGGGQVLRSCLALSMVTGRSFELYNVRGKRSKPGLKRQHLTCVRAAAEVSNAHVVGAELNSQHLKFFPQQITSGDFRFDIGSSGSTTLVFQTVAPAFLIGDHHAQVEIIGGTHNPFAPPFDFLDRVYLEQLRRLGAHVESELVEHGFHPQGGGMLRFSLRGVEQLQPLQLLERGKLQDRQVTTIVSGLPGHIGQRECDTIRRKSQWPNDCFQRLQFASEYSMANLVLIAAQFEEVTEIVTAHGRKGVTAERVAADGWKAMKDYLAHDAPVGEYLADQLLLPMGLMAHQFGHQSEFRSRKLSLHARTHIDILQRFLDVKVHVEANGQDRHVTVQ